MKRIVTLAVLTSLSFSALAATTGNLQLRGKVPKKLSIVVEPGSGANSPTALNLEQSQNEHLVAVVHEKSNSASGYKISVTSTKLGNLENQSLSSEKIPYTLSYDGQPVNLTQSNFIVKTVTDTSIHSDDSEVRISYVGVPHEQRVEGTYSDTVKFTISVN